MYKAFTLPLKSAFALATLFILTACNGFTIDLNSYLQDSECSANPFLTECDSQRNISDIRTLIIENCASNPEKSETTLCLAADAATNTPDTTESCEDNPFGDGCGGTGEVADVRDIEGVGVYLGTTPKDELAKSEFNKAGFTQAGDGKITIASLEIVDLCSDPTTADNERCTPAVLDCINNPFSGSCQGDNVLGNLVKGGVTLSKTVILQNKRAVDCRDGLIDRSQCQNLNVQKQRCAGAAFGDAICSAVTHSVCKADAFDPLCGEKENFAGVYFNERSHVCFEDPNNPNCTGANGHIAVVCNEYPFDRLCDGNANYENVRANACEVNPNVSPNCPVVVPVVPVAPVVPTPTGDRVTTADWLASFGTAGLSAPADISTPGDRFVLASATGLDRQTFVEAKYWPILVSLNLADATFGGRKLGGDAADGVVIFKGTNKFVGKDSNGWHLLSYAGILKNTDLGAPLSEPNGTTAIWHGHIRVNSAWNEKLNKDFALHVNFGAGDQAGEIRAFIKKQFTHGDRVSSLATYRLNGSFDDNGLIEGTFRENFSEFFGESEYPAVLTGLIGEEGAVGVIISEHSGRYGYVGGFVARPGLNDRVTVSDWEDRFQYPQLYENPIQWQKSDGFLEPSSTGINTAHFKKRDGTAPDIITLNLRDATFNNVALGGDVADGVAFFKGWNGNGIHPFGNGPNTPRYGNVLNRYRHFATILAGTDLGAPVTQTTGTARWNGNFQAVDYDHYLNTDFTLEIAFGAGEYAGSVNAFVQDSGDTYFKINGFFDDQGVIDGDVIYGDYLNGNINDTTNSDNRATGYMMGLIGQEGAVGIFTSNRAFTDYSTGTGFSGGFVARPPSQ